MKDIDTLIKKEGWEVLVENNKTYVLAEGYKFPRNHPFWVHAKLYRIAEDPETRYRHMKAMHDYLWPDTVWHYWTERRFRYHCEGWSFTTYAGGASTAKSYDAAKIAILFWLGDPKNRGVTVASTSLESLNARIWGYITKLMEIGKKNVDLPIVFRGGNNPKYSLRKKKRTDPYDNINGIFAVSAKQGDDETTISGWIGRHPENGLLLILDEATDMPMAIVKAFANLAAKAKGFKLLAIGNSLSWHDLHGVLSTPKAGYSAVDPLKHNAWETTQDNGICLFFSCYESPAIYETDPDRKAALSTFLITQTEIDDKGKLYGAMSDSFWRFVLGFWRTSSTDETVLSSLFLDEFDVLNKAEWSGIYPLTMVAGLDPAFSTGGDQCILRLALLGLSTSGNVVLDYRQESLLFRIQIVANSDQSAELQIADQVIKIMQNYNCPIGNLCIDANGQGRALSEVIALRAQTLARPIKIYSVRAGNVKDKSFDVVVKTAHELWFVFRDFIQNRQIKGIDQKAAYQLTTRKVLMDKTTLKQKLEPKRDYKLRMGAILPSMAHSPDEADAAALCLQSAILNFNFYPGQRKNPKPVVPGFADAFAISKIMAVHKIEEQKKEHDRSLSIEMTFPDIHNFSSVKGSLS